jgi:hypothetical protein
MQQPISDLFDQRQLRGEAVVVGRESTHSVVDSSFSVSPVTANFGLSRRVLERVERCLQVHHRRQRLNCYD